MQVQPMTQQVCVIPDTFVLIYAFIGLYICMTDSFFCYKRLQGMLGECTLAGFLLLLMSRFSIWTCHPYKLLPPSHNISKKTHFLCPKI